MKSPTLLVGTTKGLIAYKYTEGELVQTGTSFEGLDITAIHQHFDGSIFIAINHKHWGQKLYCQYPKESNWKELPVPSFHKDLKNVNGQSAFLKQIWSIHHGGEDHPNYLWIGTEPGALFLSKDRGQTYDLVEGLWNHKTRIQGKQWFGAGKDLPFLHSIIIHPENNDIIYVSVSCAGVFRSMDGGLTWNCMNTGMKAGYLPNPNPEAGYDPHLMLMSRNNHNVLWQQNHCGVYKTINGGENWLNVNGKNDYPDYGFCIAIEENGTETAWVIPVEDETQRVPPSLRLTVMKTEDGGHSWQDSGKGLPNENFFGIVLRNGFVKDKELMAFGTTNGNLYFSNDKGQSWNEISTSLSKVTYLSFIN